MSASRGRWAAAVAFLVTLVTPVGALGAASASAATQTVTFTAQAVSYDLAVGSDQRVLVGLLAGDQGMVAFGTVDFEFSYLGTKAKPVRSKAGPAVTADYKLVAGFSAADPPDTPRLIKPSQAVGVYAADRVTFDRAGRWRVLTTVRFGADTAKVPATFSVASTHAVVAEGDPAPRSDNPLAGVAGVDARAIDSRASANAPVPDPELHSTSVASALAAGLPVMVVVSTPTFCISRFCGPITDSMRALSNEYTGRVAFVHLEVWKNYQKQQLNAAAAQWILPDGSGDANEPWVFGVGADGIVRERLDNVASETDLRATAAALVT